jgi:sulfhydrogenase subunit alpha
MHPEEYREVRAMEAIYACDEALRIINNDEVPAQPFAEAIPRAGTGYRCTEAPRGILYHKYHFDERKDHTTQFSKPEDDRR